MFNLFLSIVTECSFDHSLVVIAVPFRLLKKVKFMSDQYIKSGLLILPRASKMLSLLARWTTRINHIYKIMVVQVM